MNRVVESFPRALDAVRRVMDKNDRKKADKPWADQGPHHHLNHASAHVEESFGMDLEIDEEPVDAETGEHPAAHAIARLMMFLELIERNRECRTNT